MKFAVGFGDLIYGTTVESMKIVELIFLHGNYKLMISNSEPTFLIAALVTSPLPTAKPANTSDKIKVFLNSKWYEHLNYAVLAFHHSSSTPQFFLYSTKNLDQWKKFGDKQ